MKTYDDCLESSEISEWSNGLTIPAFPKDFEMTKGVSVRREHDRYICYLDGIAVID